MRKTLKHMASPCLKLHAATRFPSFRAPAQRKQASLKAQTQGSRAQQRPGETAHQRFHGSQLLSGCSKACILRLRASWPGALSSCTDYRLLRASSCVNHGPPLAWTDLASLVSAPRPKLCTYVMIGTSGDLFRSRWPTKHHRVLQSALGISLPPALNQAAGQQVSWTETSR